MAPVLEHCFTMRGYYTKDTTLQVQTVLGGPQRYVIAISSGFLRGKGLDAEIIPGGQDAPLLDPATNTAHLDVRLNFRLKNGHAMYMHYTGKLQVDDASWLPLNFSSDAKSTQCGDHEWFSTPNMETSDPEFKWVENSIFLGEGRWHVGDDGSTAIEYEIYRARPSVRE